MTVKISCDLASLVLPKILIDLELKISTVFRVKINPDLAMQLLSKTLIVRS